MTTTARLFESAQPGRLESARRSAPRLPSFSTCRAPKSGRATRGAISSLEQLRRGSGAMIEIKLKDGEGHLEDLIEEAAASEEVVITIAGGSAVRLVALAKDERDESPSSSKVIGHALDRFIGTWSAEQAAELLQAIEVFDQVEESFWT